MTKEQLSWLLVFGAILSLAITLILCLHIEKMKELEIRVEEVKRFQLPVDATPKQSKKHWW